MRTDVAEFLSPKVRSHGKSGQTFTLENESRYGDVRRDEEKSRRLRRVGGEWRRRRLPGRRSFGSVVRLPDSFRR